ncbi:hypothetical protein PRIPAC_91296 [Pristionchus pacificus]|uniref:glucuronosyltransferase n=1 Tax=Pristionchus pacificus TaxID=54126 RepID=A0A2A6CVU3_PRIPA|nr:hypothetical protein PRIPAC_91296 [Pristionchus pacificus]|eukprot:PDM82305.1 Glycosyltransferase [Pristionchus pacificus]
MRLALFFALLGLINAAESYKILVFNPRYSQSLNNFLGNIADTLVDAGHNVTTLIPIINPHLRDGTHKSNTIYVQPNEEVNKFIEHMDFEEADFFDYNDFNMITSVPFGRDFMGWVNAECTGVLDEPGLVENLQAEKFDVMILENFETCGVALSHLIKPKSLITSAGSVPMGQQGTDLGMASALSYNPSAIISNLDVHSIWSRLWNLYAYFVFDVTWSTSRTEIDALFKARYGPNFPSEIGSQAAFSFVNSEPLIDFGTPTLSRVVPIGGINAKEPKKLEGEFDRIFNLRSKNVLISFGSIVQSHALPLQVKQNILKTVARFPDVTFLWKYEKPNDEFVKNATASTPNLHIQKWTPQNDILADKRLTAFISHGGMASTQETSLRGKPGLFVPFIGDQPRNAGMMQKNGLGKVYHKQDLYNADMFYAAVKDLLENESYYKNAAKIASMIAKKPFSSKELLVKTVEYAAQFGPSPALRPQSFDMSWIEYHNVDIIALFAGIVLIVAISALKVTTFVMKKVLRIVKLKEDQSITNYLANIADTLVEAGHNVTTVIPIVNPNLRDSTDKSIKIHVHPTEEVRKITESMDFEEADFFNYNDFNVFSGMPFGHSFTAWFNAQCEGVLDEPGLIERLRREKFDVMIVENFETCGVAISHLIKPKSLITTAGSVPMGQQGEDFGIESALSYNPNPLITHVDVHSIWSRAWNLYATAVFRAMWYTTRTEIDALFQRRYGPTFPSVYDIGSKAAFTFINREPLIDFATPILSRTICIGGIGAKEPKKLDKDLEHIFSLRNKTVLISFGSIVQSHALPMEVKKNILKAVARFPEITFLWKYERPEDAFAKSALASTPNLQMLKWTPQNDILADKRLHAFITHGGMASTQETAVRGKPGLFIPFLADQPRNSGMMEENGLGKVYHKQDLFDDEKFYAAVKDLIENESYHKNMAKIAAMIANKPFSSRDQLVKTVEFAAQFGPSAALRPQSFDMSWIEYHNVDIIAVLAVFSVIGAFVALKIASFVVTQLSSVVKFKLE